MSHSLSSSDIQYAFAIKYTSISASTVLLYDSVLSLPQEIHWIWTTHLSPSKIIYISQRYIVLGFLLYFTSEFNTTNAAPNIDTDKSCRNFPWIFGAASVTSLALTSAAILLRIFALWKRNTLVRIGIVIGYLSAYASAFVFFILGARQLRDTATYSSELKMCIFPTNPTFFLGSWIALTVMHLYTFVLVYFSPSYSPGGLQKQALRPLFMNSVRATLLNLAIVIVLIPVTIVGKSALTFICTLLVWSISTAVSAHFLLNLYRQNHHAHIRSRTSRMIEFNKQNTNSLQLTDYPPRILISVTNSYFSDVDQIRSVSSHDHSNREHIDTTNGNL